VVVAVQVLTEAQRRKWDSSDDQLFYAEPRFVQHLDDAFRARLTQLYRDRIPARAVVLDLMSSWVSHLPDDGIYERVIGHVGGSVRIAFRPLPKDDPTRRKPDIQRARAWLGFEPKVDIDEGIERTVRCFVARMSGRQAA